MKTLRLAHFIPALLIASFCQLASGHPNHDGKAPSELAITHLLSSPLSGAPNMEVILDTLTIPPHSTLPMHWHPGEEFVYLIQGSATLIQDSKEDTVFKAGEAGMVPFKQIHSAKTGDEGATIVVFRVHEKGQPHRILVDN